jgi:hypothetical protein
MAFMTSISIGCSGNALLGTGSGGRGGTSGVAGTGGTNPNQVKFEVSHEINRDVDLLVVVDNSGSMNSLQASLIAGFKSFVDVFTGLPGGLPNLHLAVVSSDIGAGAYDIGDIPSCRHGGDQGIFQSAKRGATCATAALNAGEHFISSVNGQANYTGELADAFACIAPLGEDGCNFEHPLGSMLRSLGADGNGGPPVENTNFLRPNAYLAVVIVTNEDDCSAPINSKFFDPASRYVSDPLGPVSSFRCNEYGHLCRGKRPPRTMSADLTGTCVSAEDGTLIKVAEVANALKSLKPDPSKVFVSVIAGPPAPYVVRLGMPALTEDPSQWPSVDHSCLSGDGKYFADPGVRLKTLADAFGGNGSFTSACAGDAQGVWTRLAQQLGRKMGATCLERVPDTAQNRPDCIAVDHVVTDAGTRADFRLPHCMDAPPGASCWEVNPSGSLCRALVSFERTATPTTLPESTTFTCAACQPNDARPGCSSL